MAVDADKMERHHLQWAIILVTYNGKTGPGQWAPTCGGRILVYAIQLWWENPPWLSSVFSKEDCKMLEVKDDSKGKPHAARSVGRVWEAYKKSDGIPNAFAC